MWSWLSWVVKLKKHTQITLETVKFYIKIDIFKKAFNSETDFQIMWYRLAKLCISKTCSYFFFQTEFERMYPKSLSGYLYNQKYIEAP